MEKKNNVLVPFAEKAILSPELSLYLSQKISYIYMGWRGSMFALCLLSIDTFSIVLLSILTPILNYFEHCKKQTNKERAE